MREVRDAIAATFEYFDLIVETLDETAGLATDEIIGDFLEMGLERAQETIETGQLAIGDALHPATEFAFALAFR